MIKVGINGFGRIGRLVFRAAQGRSDIQIVGKVLKDVIDANPHILVPCINIEFVKPILFLSTGDIFFKSLHCSNPSLAKMFGSYQSVPRI